MRIHAMLLRWLYDSPDNSEESDNLERQIADSVAKGRSP